MLRRALPLVLIVVASIAAATCGKSNSPTGPSQTNGPAIQMVGDLNFGDVEVGTAAVRQFQVRNTGDAPLTITGFTIGPLAEHFSVDWTNGQVQPGFSQPVNLTFRPPRTGTFNETLRAHGNQIIGTGTLAVTARGIRTGPLWQYHGAGNTVFDLPAYIGRLRIKGTWNKTGTSNFIVRLNGRGLVNEILRESITYEGVHLTEGGGVIEIVSSSNISWSFIEER